MHLISFDVGIKNLAYCVFSLNSDSNDKETVPKWSIPEWNCANLIAATDASNIVAHFCCHKMKIKKKTEPDRVCNKPAKWIVPEGVSSEETFCDLHAKKHDRYIIPKKQHSASHMNKLKLVELEKEYDSVFSGRDSDDSNPAIIYSGIVQGSRPKMKKSELIERIAKYYESKCFVSVFGANEKNESGKPISAGETDLVTIGRAIRRQLDSDSSIEGTTHVIVENQIATIASRMKTIQGMIAQYFIMRFGDSVQIEFVSSHNKLKGFSLASSSSLSTKKETDCTKKTQETGQQNAESKDAKKPTYKANKSDGIIICRRFIEANPEMESWSPIFERSKKRDDFADCFLQGIWYLKSSKKIYYADNLKINIVVVS